MFERIETARLILRKPNVADAERIFRRYSSDPEVTRLVGWPRHASIADTRLFLDFSAEQWSQWPAGPYLIETPEGELLGGTGLAFETPACAMTGYVLAKDAWGKGYATESLDAMVKLARKLGVARLYALCHPENAPSLRVLEKSGFANEGIKPRYFRFPNQNGEEPADVFSYALVLRY